MYRCHGTIQPSAESSAGFYIFIPVCVVACWRTGLTKVVPLVGRSVVRSRCKVRQWRRTGDGKSACDIKIPSHVNWDQKLDWTDTFK